MEFDYDFYIEDDTATGLFVDINKNDYVDITSLYGYGDFYGIEKSIKTLEDLKMFIVNNLGKINEKWHLSKKFSRRELVEELLDFINTSILIDSTTIINASITRKMNELKGVA